MRSQIHGVIRVLCKIISMPALAALFVCLLMWPRGVVAQEPAAGGSGSAFAQGVQLMEQGKCGEAPAPVDPCERARQLFEESFRLNPEGLGALRNRAFVEKGLGKLVQALSSFRDLAERAAKHPRPDRQAWAPLARAQAEQLNRQVSRITIDVPSSMAASLVVTLDGQPVPRSLWGQPMPQNPGRHDVAFLHGNDPPLLRQVRLAPGQDSMLSPLVGNRVETTVREPDSLWSHPSSWLMGAGGVSVAVGLGFGVAAWIKHGNVCDENNVCEAQGLRDGKQLASLSTWIVAAGGAAFVGGLLWRGLTKKEETTQALLYPTAITNGAAVVMSGRF